MRALTYSSVVGLAVAAAVTMAVACSGMTLGEHRPGGDTYADPGTPTNPDGGRVAPGTAATGGIGVDPVSENAYVVMSVVRNATTDGGLSTADNVTKRLYVVPPDTGSARDIADVTGLTDIRLLFPPGEVLLLGMNGTRQHLRRIDATTFAELQHRDLFADYNGTRLSPDGRFLVVADNASSMFPIHIIDTRTLAIEEFRHDGYTLEAMWLHSSDRLLSIVFYDPCLDTMTACTQRPHARILSWSASALAATGFARDASGLFASPDVSIDVPDVAYDLFFSFTWVGISPDDHYAVFPVRSIGTDGTADGYRLLVMDLTTNTIRTVDGAQGPVGFTPDGTTIVSYDGPTTDANGMQTAPPHLLLVDAATLAVESMPIPISSAPSFFVTREGNYVVVSASLSNESIVLYDLDHGTSTRLGGPHVSIDNFVSRLGHAELWLLSQGLYRLDFMQPTLEPIPLPFVPTAINILPRRDRLILGETLSPNVDFVDPETRVVTRRVALPLPP